MPNTKTILYLGENGFPYRMAAVNRQKYIARGLVNQGSKVVVLCRKGVHDRNDKRLEGIQPEGIFEGVHYAYCTGTIYRPSGFLNRNIQKIKGLAREFFSIVKHCRKEEVQAFMVATFSFYQLAYYKFLSLVFGVKIILDVVELNSQMDERKNFSARINDGLYEKYGYRLMHGISVISDLLHEYIKLKAPRIPVLKIPVIFDYERINPLKEKNTTSEYQLFCGSAFYLKLIRFLLDAFELVNDVDFNLKMVVNGYPEQIDTINKWVARHPKQKQIEVLSSLSDEELYAEYNNASALLIPLLNRKQDMARFPQKVSEYLATANPVLSTPVGEIEKYFEAGKTAFLAKEVTPESFAEIMTYVHQNKDIAQEVGEAGRILGTTTFDYKNIGKNLTNFIQQV